MAADDEDSWRRRFKDSVIAISNQCEGHPKLCTCGLCETPPSLIAVHLHILHAFEFISRGRDDTSSDRPCVTSLFRDGVYASHGILLARLLWTGAGRMPTEDDLRQIVWPSLTEREIRERIAGSRIAVDPGDGGAATAGRAIDTLLAHGSSASAGVKRGVCRLVCETRREVTGESVSSWPEWICPELTAQLTDPRVRPWSVERLTEAIQHAVEDEKWRDYLPCIIPSPWVLEPCFRRNSLGVTEQTLASVFVGARDALCNAAGLTAASLVRRRRIGDLHALASRRLSSFLVALKQALEEGLPIEPIPDLEYLWLQSTTCAQEQAAAAGVGRRSSPWDPRLWHRLSAHVGPVEPIRIRRVGDSLFSGRSCLQPISALHDLSARQQRWPPAVLCTSCKKAVFSAHVCSGCRQAVWCDECRSSLRVRCAHAAECARLQRLSVRVAERLVLSDQAVCQLCVAGDGGRRGRTVPLMSDSLPGLVLPTTLTSVGTGVDPETILGLWPNVAEELCRLGADGASSVCDEGIEAGSCFRDRVESLRREYLRTEATAQEAATEGRRQAKARKRRARRERRADEQADQPGPGPDRRPGSAEADDPVAEVCEPCETAVSDEAPVEAPECRICLSPLSLGGELSLAVLACGHLFCTPCSDSLVRQHGRCPMCQTDASSYLRVFV